MKPVKPQGIVTLSIANVNGKSLLEKIFSLFVLYNCLLKFIFYYVSKRSSFTLKKNHLLFKNIPVNLKYIASIYIYINNVDKEGRGGFFFYILNL